MDAKQIEKNLRSNVEWINEVALQHCPFIAKMKTPPRLSLYREVTIRVPTGERDRFGRPKPQRRRFDLIGLCKPHYKAWGSDLFAVGVEIKVSKSDLIQDAKFCDYLSYCDYFIFAVPTHLIDLALEKVTPHANIGVLDAETLTWHRLPSLNDFSIECQSELFRQIAFSK